MRLRVCGVWMKRWVVLGLVVMMALGGDLVAQEPDPRFVGDWQGTLTVGPQELPLVFHVQAGEGGLTATMDSPAQGAFGLPVDEARVAGDSLVLTMRAIQGEYAGVLQADGTLSGRWSQGPASFPLDLHPVEPGEAAESGLPDPSTRPQTPSPPYPYRSEEVAFPGGGDFELAGTLTIPAGDGPFPAAVLVSGSGPQDRDETIVGHKPFAVLADHLTRAGVAVLRYDDRGVGGSGGDFPSATSVELAADAQAAAAWLQTRPEVRGDAVGIVGHSEGGLIAPMVAARTDEVAYVVLLAGPGTTGADILDEQVRLIAEASGAPAPQIEQSLEVNRAVFQSLSGVADTKEAATRVREVLTEATQRMSEEEMGLAGIPQDDVASWIETQVQQVATPWMLFFLGYDPVPALEATRVPVLALNGELDLQVPYEENLAAIEAALARGGNGDVTVESLPGLNHLFQTAETGSPTEYATIDETMSPAVLERVAGWILARFGTG